MRDGQARALTPSRRPHELVTDLRAAEEWHDPPAGAVEEVNGPRVKRRMTVRLHAAHHLRRNAWQLRRHLRSPGTEAIHNPHHRRHGPT